VCTVRSFGVMCGGGGDMFFSRRSRRHAEKLALLPTLHARTRDVGRRGSIYIYKIHTIDIRAYILYIGAIIVVSAKTNNFTPIPCVFPGI